MHHSVDSVSARGKGGVLSRDPNLACVVTSEREGEGVVTQHPL